jgi:leucyl aminopeptidase
VIGTAVPGTSIGAVGITVSISDSAPASADADAVVIPVLAGPDGPLPGPGTQDVDAAFGGDLAGVLRTLGATGEPGEVTKIAASGRLASPLVAAVGLGEPPAGDGGQAGHFDPETLRRAAGSAARSLTGKPDRKAGGRPLRIALALPARDAGEAEAVTLGALLGSYQFRRYRDGAGPSPSFTLLAGAAAAAEGVRRAEILAAAVSLARDLVNTGPSDLVPAALAAEAERVAAGCGLSAEVLDEGALAAGGYGGIMGVGKGSAHPPRLVRLEYAPPQAGKTVVFAGKGITFDSGGLSLKPAKSMETMKCDMSGAAAVIGAMQALSALHPPVRVIGYLALAENMPSGTAQRPSDVLTTYGGTTVEVLNTDAEGRLVLADVLGRSAADSPDLLVDVATLTGALVVALGPQIAGVMGNDDRVRDAVVDASRRAGEAAWPMPLPAELRKNLDSTVADLANVGPDRNAGMLIAGLFLQEFVPARVRWAHVDIAGPAYNNGAAHGYTPKGGTGAATRMLVQIALDVADGRL